MRAERLAELEAYYSQNDDLIESHGAVLELIYAIKGQEAELRAAREVQRLLHTRMRDRSPLGAALARWDQFTRPEETQP